MLNCLVLFIFCSSNDYSGLLEPSHLKNKDLGTIFKEKRDRKGPILNQNRDQFKKKGPLIKIL